MNLTLLNRTVVLSKEKRVKEKLKFEDVHPVFGMKSAKEWPDLGIRKVKRDEKVVEKEGKVEGGGGLNIPGASVVV